MARPPATAATILVVTTDAVRREQLRDWLDLPELRVLTTEPEGSVSELTAEQPIDALLTDLDPDGLRLAQQLRQLRGRAELPVLFLAPDATSDIRDEAFQLGAVDVLIPPWHHTEVVSRVRSQLLLDQVRSWVSRYGPDLADALAMGPVTEDQPRATAQDLRTETEDEDPSTADDGHPSTAADDRPLARDQGRPPAAAGGPGAGTDTTGTDTTAPNAAERAAERSGSDNDTPTVHGDASTARHDIPTVPRGPGVGVADLLSCLPEPAWLTATDGTVLGGNAAFTALAALTTGGATDPVGRPETQLLAPELVEIVRELRQATTQRHAPASGQAWVHQGPKAICLELVAGPLTTSDGVVTATLTLARDVTAQEEERQRLRRSEAHLQRAQELARVGSWWMDLTTGRITWSTQMRRMIGVPEGEPITIERFESIVHPADRASVNAAWQAAREQGTTYDLDHRMVADDRVLWVRARGRFDRDADGQLVSAAGSLLDITEQKHAEELLEAERTRLQDAFDAADAAGWEWDLASDELRYDTRLSHLRGPIPADETLTMAAWRTRIHPDDDAPLEAEIRALLTGHSERYDAEFRWRDQQDTWVWLRALGRVVSRDNRGAPLLVRGILLDVTSLRTQQEQVRFAQTHDGLTGLANRQRFTDTLRARLTNDPDQPLAVIALDLDDFETINHAYGRAAGNLILAELAVRLLDLASERDHLARTGGDEFTLLVCEPEEELEARTDELHELLATPISLPGGSVTLSASLGVTTSPQPGRRPDADQLLRQADQAVYQAKLSGKDRTHRFDLAQHEHTRARYALLDELGQGLTDGQLVVHYQPQIDLRTGRLLGAEALVRWQHPTRGLLPPGAFIPATQGHPLAIDLGTHVLDIALRQLETWQAQGLTGLSVAVNVDEMQLEDPDFFDRTLEQLLACPTLRAEQLTLEVLETGALEDLDHVAGIIDRFQAAGITVALDDFGTGYASLTFLKRLHARLIKIDRSFTQRLLDDPEDALIVHAITTLARNLGRTAFAEGVETTQQGRLLLQLGCDQGQGYYISRPLPGDALADWLETWKPPTAWTDVTPLEADELPALIRRLRAEVADVAADAEAADAEAAQGNSDQPA